MAATPSTTIDVSKLIADTGKSLRKAQRELGKPIAAAARAAIRDDVRNVRGSLRFGTNPKTGARYRLGITSTIEPTATGVNVIVTPSKQTAGFWSIVEYGSRAHEIVPKTKKALFFLDLYSASVWHPGTTGGFYWAGAEQALDRAVAPLIEHTVDEALGVAA